MEDARQREHQRVMEEGLLDTHGLELDKSWIRMLRIIKSQVRCSGVDSFACPGSDVVLIPG